MRRFVQALRHHQPARRLHAAADGPGLRADAVRPRPRVQAQPRRPHQRRQLLTPAVQCSHGRPLLLHQRCLTPTSSVLDSTPTSMVFKTPTSTVFNSYINGVSLLHQRSLTLLLHQRRLVLFLHQQYLILLQHQRCLTGLR